MRRSAEKLVTVAWCVEVEETSDRTLRNGHEPSACAPVRLIARASEFVADGKRDALSLGSGLLRPSDDPALRDSADSR